MDMGFSPSSLGKAPRMGSPVSSHVAGTGRSRLSDAIVAGESNLAPRITAQEARIHRFETTKSVFTLPWQMEFFGMIGGGALTWVTKKMGLERTTAGIKMALTSPFEAMRRTTLADATQLPANMVKSMSQQADIAGGKAANWGPGLNATADKWAANGAALSGQIEASTRGMRSSVGRGITTFEGTGIGTTMHGAFDRLMSNRAEAAVARHGKHLAKAISKATTQQPGFFASITNFLTRREPQVVAVGELKPVMNGLEASSRFSGIKKVAHLQGVQSELDALIKSGKLEGEVARRASAVSQRVGKALGSAHAMHTYETAAGGTLKTMVKALGKAAGRVPVFSAVVGVGVAAGLGATVLHSRLESQQARQAFAELEADVGSNAKDSGFMKAAYAAHKSDKGLHVVKAGMELAGGAAEGALFVLPGGGGMALAGGMMLPPMIASLVPGNDMLSAYTALKKEERGELKFEEPGQRLAAIKQLVAVLPNVVAHGGVYNRLVGPVASAISDRQMKAHEIVQLLANDTAFTAFVGEVDAKRQAEEAIAKASESSAKEVSAPPQLAAGKPGLQVSAMEHKGTVEERALARA